MMVAAPLVTDSVRALIDHRLDAIDRLLILNGTPRQDRLTIVAEVESQIFALLESRGTETPGRDDVLAVLAQLDPPEAYVTESPQERSPEIRRPSVNVSCSVPPAGDVADSRIGKTSGILGLAMVSLVVLLPAFYLLTAWTESTVVFYGGFGGVMVFMGGGGLVAGVLALVARLKGAWAIVGLVTGAVSLLFSLFVGLFLVLAINGL